MAAIQKILITSPSLKTEENVSGISSVTKFIIANNQGKHYQHFELGRKDNENRNFIWAISLAKKMISWVYITTFTKIKLIHFNLALSKASIVRDAPLILYAKLINKSMVIHLHGGDYLTNEKIPGWIRKILKKILSGKAQIIVLGKREEELIKKKFNAKNIKILPNCVDLTEARMYSRNFDTTTPLRLLFLGRITTEKGLDYISESLKNLKDKLSFTFIMAGTGPSEKMYVEKFSNMLGNQFEFKGTVSGHNKSNLFKTCNIFLLPSLFEGLPMSLLESMSFGMVPVVTPVGSMKDVVIDNQTGIIIKDNPSSEITDVILRLAGNHALLQELSKNAAEFINQHYNPENYIIELNRIYSAA